MWKYLAALSRQICPPDSLESLIEYNHRLVSGVVGILVTWQSIWAWKN